MKLTINKLKCIIKEELEAIVEGDKPEPQFQNAGEQYSDDLAMQGGDWHGDEDEDPNAPDEKPFVLHFLNLLVNGETGQPFTPEEIAAMGPKEIGALASQMRGALRSKGAKRIPPLNDPGAFDPFTGQ